MTRPTNRYRCNDTAEKIRGAVYTPSHIADALVRWAVRSPADHVLDPACGDGVFLAATRAWLTTMGNACPTCLGIDIDAEAAHAAGGIQRDFFAWAAHNQSARFDAIVGNPPFIRSHLFAEESRSLAYDQMRQMGVKPSRLMSAWAPFVAVSCSLLTPHGRLAFVVPEELLHVNYAAELRRFLLTHFRRVYICLPEYELFSTVQQSVILLLCDNDPGGDAGLLDMRWDSLMQGASAHATPAPPWRWSHKHKWTHLFLHPTERQAITDWFACLNWHPLDTYGRVEVGIVTGSNDFFIVSEQKKQSLDAPACFVPIVTGTRDVQGIDITHDDFCALTEQGKPSFLLHTSAPTGMLPDTVQTYLSQGIAAGINRRFKCRTRDPWYTVPGVRNAQALLLRQAGAIPRMVHVSHPCTCTDTIHRVSWKQPAMGRRHVVSFLNVWTLIACELMGRSYGGGVLELMPSEANKLIFPPPVAELDGIFASVDALVRTRRFFEAARVVSTIVTPPAIPPEQQDAAFDTLNRLIERRKRKGIRACSKKGA